MKPFDLDKASRLLASRQSRRATLAGGAAALAAGVLVSGRAGAQQATPEGEATPELLFVQTFNTGELAPGTVGDGTFILTLSDGIGSTIYFSDRPNRFVGTIPTEEFLTELGNAADDPPNAALLAEVADGELTLVVELLSAQLDDATGTVTYVARILTEDESEMQFDSPLSLPPTEAISLGRCHLFIDGMSLGCSPWDPRC